jgi:hypothetical protein
MGWEKGNEAQRHLAEANVDLIEQLTDELWYRLEIHGPNVMRSTLANLTAMMLACCTAEDDPDRFIFWNKEMLSFTNKTISLTDSHYRILMEEKHEPTR